MVLMRHDASCRTGRKHAINNQRIYASADEKALGIFSPLKACSVMPNWTISARLLFWRLDRAVRSSMAGSLTRRVTSSCTV